MSIGEDPIAVVGMGAITPYGAGVDVFLSSLLGGRSAVAAHLMAPFDEPRPAALLERKPVGEWLAECELLTENRLTLVKRVLRRAPLPVMLASIAGMEAWLDAGLGLESEVASENAVVVGGHDLGMRYEEELREKFEKSRHHLPPSYAVHMLDTDHVGSLSAVLPIRGIGFTVGGASGSGNMALIQGGGLLTAGLARRCLVVGAMADLSSMALQAFDTIGALGGADYSLDPQAASRPFDHDRNGFIYAQGTGAVVLEKLSDARNRGAPVYGLILGSGIVLDGTPLPSPSVTGEIGSMELAIERSGLRLAQIDLVNAHGTASRAGDEVELEAIATVFSELGQSPLIQSTKGLLGHGLWAAGVLEVIASLGQMKAGVLHPNLNLEAPIREDLRFIGKDPLEKVVKVILSNSFGFAGINTSIVLGRWSGEGGHG